MFNISVTIVTLLILISQNILLLNEESLILLCFITFIWLTLNKTKSSFQKNFEDRAATIQNSIEISFDHLLDSLNKELNIQQEFKSLICNFYDLKQHFINLNLLVSSKLIIFKANRYQKSYEKKLIFVQRLETQISKLIALLVIKKLNQIIQLKRYYLKKFHIPALLCNYKISLREYFETV